MTYCVIANFGNESIALIQWLYEHKHQNVLVLSVDTGWGAECFNERVKNAQAWVKTLGFKEVRLTSKPDMIDCVKDRGDFPSKKFHWCAGFIKGLAFEAYLDEHDPTCEYQMVFAKRKAASRANQMLHASETSEHFHDRKVWHPLLSLTDKERDELIRKAGFEVLPHTSLECAPCIHAKRADLNLLSPNDIKRLHQVEKTLNKTMFNKSIVALCNESKDLAETQYASLEEYDKGCGSAYSCGE